MHEKNQNVIISTSAAMFLGTKPNITEYQHRYVKHANWNDAHPKAVLPLCPQIFPLSTSSRLTPTAQSTYQNTYNVSAQLQLSGKYKKDDGKKKKPSAKAMHKQRAHQYANRAAFESSTTYGDAYVRPPKGTKPEKLCRPKPKAGGPIADVDHKTSTPSKSTANETFHGYTRLELADIAANAKVTKSLIKGRLKNASCRLPVSVPLSKHTMYMLEYPWKKLGAAETLYLRQQSRKNKSSLKSSNIIGQEASNEEAKQKDRHAQFETTARLSFGGAQEKADRRKKFVADNVKVVTHCPGKYYLDKAKIIHKHPEATFDDARMSVTLTKT